MRKIVFFFLLLVSIACHQVISQDLPSELKINTTLSDPFFKDTVYLSKPSKVTVYRNDSLEVQTVADDGIQTNTISNAFIEDRVKQRFGLKMGIRTNVGDTAVIVFSDLASSEKLELKIFGKQVWVSYLEKEEATKKWYVCSKSVVLNSELRSNTKILGFLDISFSESRDCKTIAINFHGPFYLLPD